MTRALQRAFALLALLCASTHAHAELKVLANDGSLSDSFPPTPILLMYGNETTNVTVLYRGEAPVFTVVESVTAADRDVWYAGEVSEASVFDDNVPNKSEWTNYSIPFVFDQGVGRTQWSFVVHLSNGRRESIHGEFVVAGLVVRQNGNIVSGINRQGITIPSYESFVLSPQDLQLDVKFCNMQGSENVDISATTFSATDVMSGTDLKQLASANITANGKLNVVIGKYRVGSGKFIINIAVPGIDLNGKVHETMLKVKMDNVATPPAVVVLESATSTPGYLSVPMYNLLDPPAIKNVQSCTLTIGANAISFDPTMSKLVQPDQTIVFKTGGHAGLASVSCDGAGAIVLGGFPNNTFGISSTGSVLLPNRSSHGLAASLIEPRLCDKEAMVRLDTQLRVVSADPKTYTMESAQTILEAVCFFSNGTSCTLVNVTKGSAILDINNYVGSGKEERGRESLEHSIRSCTFQKRVGVPCSEIELNKSIKAHTAPGNNNQEPAKGRETGPPSHAPIVAGLVGGLCLVLVVIGSLWFVHRHNNIRTESEISSSGPIGVPDADDVVYQQAIVRDIYGRGDFSSGGSTPEAVALRRREFEFRESSPRPALSVVSSLRPPRSTGASSAYAS
jgi:hypothetical protein